MDYEDEQSDPVTREQYALRKLVVEHGDEAIQGHRWLWERDRWHELVFSILASSSKLTESDARVVTGRMEALGLISVSTLARAHENRITKKGSLTLERISDLLREAGCSDDDSVRTAEAMAEAANYFYVNHQGKVQVLFRRIGEAMFRELREGISFSRLSSAEAEHALVYWLQNVLCLPISLKDEAVMEFAAEYSLTPESLIGAADSMGLNIAFLDDLIHSRKNRKNDLSRGDTNEAN